MFFFHQKPNGKFYLFYVKWQKRQYMLIWYIDNTCWTLIKIITSEPKLLETSLIFYASEMIHDLIKELQTLQKVRSALIFVYDYNDFLHVLVQSSNSNLIKYPNLILSNSYLCFLSFVSFPNIRMSKNKTWIINHNLFRYCFEFF